MSKVTDTIPLDDKLDKCPKLSVHWVRIWEFGRMAFGMLFVVNYLPFRVWLEF